MNEDEFDPAPAGWALRHYPETFGGRAGPFYFREDGERPGVGFFSKPHHGNLGGVVHGGALMTLADMALFSIAWDALDGDMAVTVALNADFLRPAPLGVFIEASGEVVRAGRSLIVVRGDITTGGKRLLSFSGSIMRLPPSHSDGAGAA